MFATFITGTGTDIGKTFVACALIRALLAEGREVDAFKPLLSGYETFEGSDPQRLLTALGRTQRDLDHIAPLRFRAPISPPSAAEEEGVTLDYADILQRCTDRIAADEYGLLLIEGAGGVMSPVTRAQSNLDLIYDLGIPVILVTGSYLGAISHTLTAYKVLADMTIPVWAIVISESGPGAPPTSELTQALEDMIPGVPVIVAPRDPDWTAQALAALV